MLKARIFLTTEMPAYILARNGRHNHQDGHRGGLGARGAIQEAGTPRRLGQGAEALGKEAQGDSEGGGEEEVGEEMKRFERVGVSGLSAKSPIGTNLSVLKMSGPEFLGYLGRKPQSHKLAYS